MKKLAVGAIVTGATLAAGAITALVSDNKVMSKTIRRTQEEKWEAYSERSKAERDLMEAKSKARSLGFKLESMKRRYEFLQEMYDMDHMHAIALNENRRRDMKKDRQEVNKRLDELAERREDTNKRLDALAKRRIGFMEQ